MGKTLIRVDCVDQRLFVTSPQSIASGGWNEDVIEFNFCPLWDGYAKTAVFYRSEDNVYHAVLSGDQCIIPHEVLTTDGWMYFGVFGTKGETTRTTEVIRYRVVKGALTSGTKPSDPTPEIYAQILEHVSGVHVRLDPIEAAIADLQNFAPQPFEATGDIVQLDNYEGMPMDCVTRIEPIQQGSGDPSPDNIRPISGRTSATLTRAGKNLLPRPYKDGDSKTDNGVTYTVNSDGSVNAQGLPTAYSSFAMYDGNVFPGDVIMTIGDDVSGMVVNVQSYSSNGELVFNTRSAAPSDPILIDYTNHPSVVRTVIAAVRQNNNTEVSGVMRPMIRLASESDATYEPYQGETVAVDFGSTVYGGAIDWNKGVLTVDSALVTIDGNSNIVKSGKDTESIFYIACHDMAKLSDYKNALMCNAFSAVTRQTDLYGGIVGVTGYYSESSPYPGQNWLYFSDGVHYTAADMKAWLAEYPIQVCYKLAEPYTIQLTPAQLTALQGHNTIWSDAGETTVSGRKDVLWLTSNLMRRVAELEGLVAALSAAAAE